jgi:hypothetical protein
MRIEIVSGVLSNDLNSGVGDLIKLGRVVEERSDEIE